MKCLSIVQPWAWAILAGLLDADYRCHPTDYRGDVLLHAARGGGAWERAQLAAFPQAPDWEDLAFGQVIGMAELWTCEPGVGGEWAWRLRNPRPLRRPFLLKPGKRLFDVSDDLVRKATRR